MKTKAILKRLLALALCISMACPSNLVALAADTTEDVAVVDEVVEDTTEDTADEEIVSGSEEETPVVEETTPSEPETPAPEAPAPESEGEEVIDTLEVEQEVELLADEPILLELHADELKAGSSNPFSNADLWAFLASDKMFNAQPFVGSYTTLVSWKQTTIQVNGDFRYNTDNNALTSALGSLKAATPLTNDDNVLSDITDNTYYVWRCNGASALAGGAYYTEQLLLEVKTFYNATATSVVLPTGVTLEDGVSPLTINGVAYGSTTTAHKVYKDTTEGSANYGEYPATLVFKQIDGYDAVLKVNGVSEQLGTPAEGADYSTVVTLAEDTTLELSYIKVVPKTQVNFQIVGNGTVDKASAEYNEGDTLTFTATPEAGSKYYVESITVNGGENIVDASKFTDTVNRSYKSGLAIAKDSDTYNVVVTFAEAKLVAKDPITGVGFNFEKGIADQLDAVKTNIFNAAVDTENSIPSDLEVSDLTYKFYQIGKLTGNTYGSPVDLTADNTGYTYFGENGLNSTEKIHLAYAGDARFPALTLEANITLVEGRPYQEAAIEMKDADNNVIATSSDNAFEYYDVNTLNAALLAAAKVTKGNGTITKVEMIGEPEKDKPISVSVKVTISETDDYQATEYTVNGVWVELKAKPATINIDLAEGSTAGTVKVGSLEADGTLVAGNYDIVATPGTDKGYVESVTVNGTALDVATLEKYGADRAFTEAGYAIANETTYNVVVKFAERAITANDPIGTVAMNTAVNASDQIAALRTNIFNAVVASSTPDGLTEANTKIEFYQNGIAGFLAGYAELKDSNGWIANGVFEDDGDSVLVKLTATADARFPEVSVEATVVLKESRTAAEITINAPAMVEFDTYEELLAAVSADSVVSTNQGEVTVAWDEEYTKPSLTKDGEEQKAYFVATVADSAASLGATEKFEVTVKGRVNPATINIADAANGTVVITDGNGASVANGSKHVADTLTIVATPNAGYYVESVKINDVDAIADSYTKSNHAFNDTFVIANANYNEDGEYVDSVYNVVVTFAKREIILKDEIGNVTYNMASDFTDDEVREAFLERAFIAAVEGSNPSGILYSDCSVELEGDAPVLGENEITIIWNPSLDGRYPQIEVNDVVINVTEERTQDKITVTTDENGVVNSTALEVDGNLEGVIAAVQAVTKVASGRTPSYTIVNPDDIPLQGEEKEIKVKVSLEEDEHFLAPETVEVIVKVVGEVHPATVTVAMTGEGSVDVTQAEKSIGESVFAKDGALTITAEPAEGFYVDSITVNGDAIDMTQMSNSLGFTAELEVVDGTGKDAAALVNAYAIKVNFVERTLPLKEGPYTIGVNPTSFTSAYIDELEAAMFEAMIGSESGLTLNDVTIKFNVALFGYQELSLLNKVVFGEELLTAGVDTEDIQITLKASGKYPEVVAEGLELNLYDDRNAAISVGEVTDLEYIDEAEVKAHVEKFVTKPADATVTITLADGYTLPTEHDTPTEVQYVVTYLGDTNNKAQTITTNVFKVTKKLSDCTVTVTEEEGSGTVKINGTEVGTDGVGVLGNTEATISAAPAKGFAVKSIKLGEEELELTYASQVATATFTTEAAVEYAVTVEYEVAAFTFVEDAEFGFRSGYDKIVTQEDHDKLYNAVVVSPALVDALAEEGSDALRSAEYKIEYLARPAGETVEIPKIEVMGVVLYPGGSYELPELWLDVDAEVKEVDINEIYTKLTKGELSLSDLRNLQIKAHNFGEFETETLRMSYQDNKWLIADAQTTVKIVDPRTVTTISGNDATVKYGLYTAEELISLMNLSVSNGGTVVLPEDVETYNVGTYEITVTYPGNEDYRPCEATFTLTVEKAPCSIDYDSQFVKWGEHYNFVLVKNPADVDTIDFMVGVDLAEGADGYIALVLPEAIRKYDVLNILNGEFKLSELENILRGMISTGDNLLTSIGIPVETVDALINALSAIVDATGEADITIRITESLTPDNVGIYLAGAVTVDQNYETAFTMDYLVVYPDGTKADLQYDVVDENGIITASLLKKDIYTLAASAFVDGEYSEEATAEITHLFMGVDKNGETVVINTKNEDEFPETVGAWTQLSYIADWGNELYYAMPIGRAFVIVDELVKVEFVDENGNVSAERQYTYDGTGHAMDVRVTDIAGDVIDPAYAEQYLTVRYTGYSLNHPETLYNSTEAPVDAGVYTAVATYNEDGEGVEFPRYGATAGAMVILPAEADITVNSQSVKYNEYDGTFSATVTPEDCKYITVIAGIDASGNFLTEGLNAFTGAVNVDFPSRIDEVLKTVMPSAYEGGISVNDILTQLEKVQERLAELGLGEDEIAIVVDFLSQIPVTEAGDVKVTFHEYADAKPENVGLYILGAITCDPNYTVASDFGYLALIPDAVEVELGFNTVDVNGFITSSYIKNGLYDMGAHVKVTDTVDEETAADAQQYVSNIYIGVDKNGNFVKSTTPSAALGVYTQVAFILDAGNVIYYAEPVTRTYTVVPEQAYIHFEDDNVERLFTFNGKPQGMNAYVVDSNGNELTAGELTLVYVGYDADDREFYRSTEAPTNVGSYKVFATYYDSELEQIGMNAAAMVISPADATLDVPNVVVERGTAYDFNIVAEGVEIDGVKDPVKYITITRGLKDEGKLFVDGIETVDGVINVDFPASVDPYIQKILPEAYTTGIDLIDIEQDLAEVKAIYEKLGLDTTAIDKVLAVVNESAVSDMDLIVTFKDFAEIKPVEMGVYLVTAISYDVNYKPAVDTGVIAITSGIKSAELTFNEGFEGVIDTLRKGDSHDFGVTGTVKATGDKVPADMINVVFTGITENGEAYESSEAPTEAGHYTQIAYLDYDNDTYVALPIVRTFAIVYRDADIELDVENVVYDGEAHGAEFELVDDDTEEAIEGEVSLRYVGVQNGVKFYDSSEAPTQAGLYTVTATFAGNDMYIPDVEVRTFTIARRTLEIQILDASKKWGDEDPKLEYEIVSGLVEGDEVNITIEREKGEEIGTYVINHTLKNLVDNLNYQVDSHNGTFTIEKREVIVNIAKEQGKIYGNVDPAIDFTLEGDEILPDTEYEFSVSREEGEDVGYYDYIVEYEIDEEHYTVTVDADQFNIAKRTAFITFDDLTKTYGDEDPEFTFTIEGAAEEGDVKVTQVSRAGGNNVGEYAITGYYTCNLKNYTVVVEDGTLTITQAAQTVPEVKAEEVTATSITVTAVEGAEYSIDDGQTWQTSNEFTGLTPETEYTITVRLPESKNYKESEWVKVDVTTDKAPAELEKLTGTVTVTGNAVVGETLTATVTDTNNTGTLVYQWIRDGKEIEGANSAEYVLGKDDIGAMIACVVTSSVETDALTSNEVGPVAKAAQEAPEAPELAEDGLKGGSITVKAEAGYEYRLGEDGEWVKAADGATTVTFDGLTPNTEYKVYARKAETATHKASDASEALVVKTASSDCTKDIVAANCPSKHFSDLKLPGSWYHLSVDYVVARGIMVGTTEGVNTFSPKMTTTRAMIVSMLYRLSGDTVTNAERNTAAAKFKDIKKGSWYFDAVAWALANNVVAGTSDTTFSPNNIITREQLAAMMHRFAVTYMGLSDSGRANLSQFPDGNTVSGWAKADMQWAVANGLISGRSNGGVTTLSPKGDATRVEAASLFHRFCLHVGK